MTRSKWELFIDGQSLSDFANAHLEPDTAPPAPGIVELVFPLISPGWDLHSFLFACWFSIAPPEFRRERTAVRELLVRRWKP